MERQLSNVGSYYFKHDSDEETDKHESEPEETSVQPDKDKRVEPSSNLVHNSEKPYRKALNYSCEDIHALASKAELLVLTTSAHNDSNDSDDGDDSDDSDGEEENTGYISETTDTEPDYLEPTSLPPDYSSCPDTTLPSQDTPSWCLSAQDQDQQAPADTEHQEENSLQLSGTWDHDLQEQYLSEGSTLGSWDNSMKSVLCFGEDYSHYIRRRSELPALDNIQTNISGLEGSPSHQKHDEIDPIILLRMSERDWISAVQELNEKKETNFGEKENYERMITTCTVNLEILRGLDITTQTSRPKCLAQDHKDLMGTWVLLLADLNKKLVQYKTYNQINCDIQKFSSQLDKVETERVDLDCQEDVDLARQMDRLKNILSKLEEMKPNLVEPTNSVHHLLSSVSSTLPEDVQKISLVCFCKQELILLNTRWEEAHSEATTCMDHYQKSIRHRQILEKDMARLEQWVGRDHWVTRTFAKSSQDIVFDKEKVYSLKKQLENLKDSRTISKSYFDKSSKYLDLADQQLVRPEEALPCVNSDTTLPLLVVTSLIIIYTYNYYYPVNWWDQACRLYQIVAW